ncbi:MAG: CDP-diacylglycerol--serine O-phosphatidyltransferase [Bacteroidales bacterium]|nr:CDP-diacylglycerol--serine O-phosphatidyltransferase [Bacteroidales bacterium]
MKIINKLPNLLTLINLLAGCLALLAIFSDKLTIAVYLIGAALLFDFLDGAFARILKAQSDMGKELDSLADVVSFGVVPGFIMFMLIKDTVQDIPSGYPVDLFLPYTGLLIPLFSALRLAKFNIDPLQREIFIGLPTPASAILIASFPLILHFQSDIIWANYLLENKYVLIIITILISFLLISPIRLFSLKFKVLAWNENRSRYIFLLLSFLAILFLHFMAIPLIIFLYILMSLVVQRRLSV